MGDTLAHYAAYNSQFALIKYLFEKNIHFDTPNTVLIYIYLERTYTH